MKLNDKLLNKNFIKTTNTTSETDTYSCTYVNNNLQPLVNYSTSEVNTGVKWIDGKTIYRKVIDIGNLPNATSKTIATGINFNNARLINMYGFCKYATNNVSFPIPFNSPTNLNFAISINIDNSNNVVVSTGSDRSDYSGYVIIEYIKTS